MSLNDLKWARANNSLAWSGCLDVWRVKMKPIKRNEQSLTASTTGKWTTFTAVLVVLLGTASFGFGQTRSKSAPEKGIPAASSKLSPELAAIMNQLQGRSSNQRLSVIVQFKHSPSAVQLQKLAVSGDSPRRFSLIRGGALTLTVNGIRVLAKNPEVAYISPNRSLKGAADYTEATVGADVAQSYGWDGAGVTVAVIDSGINNHPDLRDPVTGLSRVIYNESFVPGTTPNDQYGHGTHVAGILAGNGTQSSGALNAVQRISGVAPSVQLVNLKVLDANGSGQDSYVIAALQRAIALKDTYNIRIVNLSLGRPVFESYTQDPVCQAVEAAWQAGLVVVVAAGNSGRKNDFGMQGYGTISAPGNDPYVITVGAMNAKNSPNKADDVIASYSSKGPSMLDHVVKPDLVAPGNRIASLLSPKSTLDVKYPTNEVSAASYGGTLWGTKSYFFLSGTSMATPVVSGAVAMMLEQEGTLTPDTVKARLMKSADKTFPVSSTLTVGGVSQTLSIRHFHGGRGLFEHSACPWQ